MTERTKYQKFEAIELHRRDIKGAPYNPRGIAPANRSRLKKALKKHGLIETIVFNKRTGNLVGGHQRLSVLDELEGTDDYTLTVSVVDVDEYQEKTQNIALNNPRMQGHFDKDLERELYEDLISNGIPIEDAGLTTTDLQMDFPDIFATGQLAEQLEAEADIVNTIHDMHRVGTEYESEFRDAMGLEPTKQMRNKMPDVNPMPDDYDAEGGESSWANTEPPEPQHANGGTNKDWSHDKDYYKQERQRVVNDNAVKSDADVLLTFAFQTKDQLTGFLKSFNLPENKRYLDVHDVMGAFGVEL